MITTTRIPALPVALWVRTHLTYRYSMYGDVGAGTGGAMGICVTVIVLVAAEMESTTERACQCHHWGRDQRVPRRGPSRYAMEYASLFFHPSPFFVVKIRPPQCIVERDAGTVIVCPGSS